MEMKIMSLDGSAGESVTLSDEIFGLEPRTDLIHRYVVWQLAKRRAGTHAVKNRADINRTGKKMYRQKGTGSARHGPAKVNLFRGGGRSFGPVVRSHEIGLPKKVRALALKHALSAKAKDGGIIVLDNASVKDAKTGALQKNLVKLGLEVGADRRWRAGGRELRTRGAQHPEHRRAAGAGHQRVRHPAAAETGSDQGGRRSAGGAVQMTTTDPRHYDVILSPVITEKATTASEHGQVVFKVARGATKPQIKDAVEKLFDVKVKSVNTNIRKGKIKAVKGRIGEQSEVKRAIVTLEEGHHIDVTTGL